MSIGLPHVIMVIRRWRIVNAKEIMAQNIMRYLRSKGCSRNDLCHDLGFNYNTLADWIHARKYPRIEKIDAMARYFGVTRADSDSSEIRVPSPPASNTTFI